MDSANLVRRNRQMPVSSYPLVLVRVMVRMAMFVFVLVMVMRFVLVDMNVRMVITRMAVAHSDPAVRRAVGVDQQQLGRSWRTKYRRPSNDPFAQYLHLMRCLRWNRIATIFFRDAYESQSAKAVCGRSRLWPAL